MAKLLAHRRPVATLFNRFLDSKTHPCARRSLQTLAYEEVQSSTAPKSTAFILHGLLGSGRNWRSFAKSLAAALLDSSSSEWRMVLLDLRNHGKSSEYEGFDPPHDMVNAARDMAELVKSKGWDWPEVVIGHSMGGKVALQFGQSCAHGDYGQNVSIPKQLWLLDSVPGEVSSENSDGEVEKVLQTLQNLPSSIPSRRWLVNHLLELGFSRELSEWLGSNLKTSAEGETWTFNFEGAIQMFNSYRETSYWSLLEHPPKGMDIEIVRAENSDRWDSDVIKRLDVVTSQERDESVGKVSVHILPNSGHWVHVENPKGLIEIMVPKFMPL